ncbi:MAG: lipoprotein [Candidatus Magnetoglobus multicellularis str. Araruama]|uniref:Lipoprotein n=1 Tax=Candidatus Magnetoglobus multicellularis str. Araruama TaxID=890399 RepID=A0A1V1NW04_9BACT|nr:MAG: lipoprotein [Candidatus Magnetoglobus multicellularis str. Araruama]
MAKFLLYNQEGNMFKNKLLATMLIFFILIVSGCIDDGDEGDEIVLPADNNLNLYCENVGIHPEKCVMDDEENPYRYTGVNEEKKWDLCSGYPKADFYLWATALASTATGENQFKVAEQLHKLYTLEGNEHIRLQTIKAYRALLDHFYWSTTYTEAWWIEDEDIVYAEEALRHMAGKRLLGTWTDDDTNETKNIKGMTLGNGMLLDNLFETEFHAQDEMNKWGYIFDKVNEVLDHT